MKQIISQTLLFLFIIASLFMGGFIVGAFSIRIYVSVVIFLWLLFTGSRFKITKEIGLFYMFILFYWIALAINGELAEVDFLKYCLGRYFICITAIYSITIIVNKPQILRNVVYLFVGIGVINGVISFLQFIGNPTAIIIPLFFYPTRDLQESLEVFDQFESGLGVGVVGLFGSIVKNGYLSAVFAALSPILYESAKKKWQQLGALIVMSFLLYSVFLTQQRLVLILVTGFFLFYFYKNRRLFFAIVGLSIILFYYFSFQEIIFNEDKLGRLAQLNDSGRIKIYSLGFEFVKNNFLFGGQNAFGYVLSSYGFRVYSSHNFFLNAFIYSGFIGAVFIIILFFKMLVQASKVIFRKIEKNKFSFFLAAALLVYLLNSLTHNASLVTGDEYIWMLFALLTKSIEFETYTDHKKLY